VHSNAASRLVVRITVIADYGLPVAPVNARNP
jgi:hypothetical protein